MTSVDLNTDMQMEFLGSFRLFCSDSLDGSFSNSLSAPQGKALNSCDMELVDEIPRQHIN